MPVLGRFQRVSQSLSPIQTKSSRGCSATASNAAICRSSEFVESRDVAVFEIFVLGLGLSRLLSLTYDPTIRVVKRGHGPFSYNFFMSYMLLSSSCTSSSSDPSFFFLGCFASPWSSSRQACLLKNCSSVCELNAAAVAPAAQT